MEEVKKDVVQETQDLFNTYSRNRETWAQHAQEDREFRMGKQWSAEQEAVLNSRGQAAIVVNRIHPAVEAAKSLITSRKPTFRVTPREDSDNKTAKAINGVLEYIWQISDGNEKMRNVVDDYYVTGMGAMLAYQDPMSDMGKGEVKLKDIDPLDLYIDPNSRDKFCDDAENIIISRLFTKNQAIKMQPMFNDAIMGASGDQLSDRPSTDRVGNGEVTFPEDSQTKTDVTFGEGDEYIRGYERYQKIMVHRFRVFEAFSRKEDLLTEDAFRQYMQKPAWIINGQIIVNPQAAQQMIQQLQMQYQAAQNQVTNQNSKAAEEEFMMAQQVAMGQRPGQTPYAVDPKPPQIQQITFEQLIQQQAIKVVKVPVWRIKMTVVMGDALLYERILPIEHYPIVLFMNLHTRTPYPQSDVRMVKHLQEYINKIRSLIIAHATTSTNVKILVPEGSVDMAEFEQKWAQPGVAIQFDPTDGAPMPVQPMPMPNELYKNELDAKNDIDHALGLYSMMMGNSQAAPATYKATISLDEFGQRKIRSKLGDIESALRRLCEVVIPLMQQLYTSEKLVRLLQPNNSMSEYMINKRMYDDKGREIEVMNNITIGKYDVIVVAGSSLPSNRYAELELYMEAYKAKIIDRQEVLKKTEIFDIEGVMQRTDVMGQMEQHIKQQEEQIKKLKGDLQTREREAFHAKQDKEIEKFKSKLNVTSTKAKAAGDIYGQRLNDSMSEISKEVQGAQVTRKQIDGEKRTFENYREKEWANLRKEKNKE